MNDTATPATLEAYAFWVKRPIDSEAWPFMFRKRELADACPWRVSDVVVVTTTQREPVNIA